MPAQELRNGLEPHESSAARCARFVTTFGSLLSGLAEESDVMHKNLAPLGAEHVQANSASGIQVFPLAGLPTEGVA